LKENPIKLKENKDWIKETQ